MHVTLETGTVAAIEDGPGCMVALVAMDPPDGGQEECATCRMCYKKDGCERLLPAQLADGDAAIPAGARVEVEIAHPSLYLPVLVVLFLPLVGIVGGGALGYALGSGWGGRDLISVVFAVAGGAAFFIAGRFAFRKSLRSLKRGARVRRIL